MVIEIFPGIHIYIIPGKNSKNDNQNFEADFRFIFSFDFDPVLVFLRRFLTFCIVFWALNDVGNQFPGCHLFPGETYVLYLRVEKVISLDKVSFLDLIQTDRHCNL